MEKFTLPEYHQSSVGMFQKCARQWMYRHAMNLVMPPKAALTLGSAVDRATTKNYQQKILSRTDLKPSDVQDMFSTEFDKLAVETQWDGEDKGEQKDLGAKMVKVFQEEAAPKIQPIAVQVGFRIETDSGYAVGGTMDLVDEAQVIRDTKTSKTGADYKGDRIADSIQATMYSFAYKATTGAEPAGFAYDVVTKHKTPQYINSAGKVEQPQIDRMFESINIMHSQIKRGEFNYAPEGQWYCSKDWCGYWHLCKGKK